MNNRNTQTAAEAYEASRNETAILIDCIQMELKALAVENPDWTDAGDAAHIAAEIRNILATLLVARHGIGEDEAEAMIAGHLAESRD